ncbi:protein-L-isoaspartate O-methyltransferase [Christiangramia fulva]|uniref:Protein-L-isoaspartate O-methyltransferase n=2 Tax=Christiangramia fulva TaxID=2126553 RepID=A0A2R3ZAY6_9FLAO|nr:protein-L-isoaspartate O-methyltransferase [Christiangramia fulva]
MMTTREEMIEEQLKGRGIKNDNVLKAMKEVDRAHFVPDDVKAHAYDDSPLPIGEKQTISQPYIVAYMAERLKLTHEDTVLEIGTGCGYNAAVLSRLCRHVYSVEYIDRLVDFARENFSQTDIGNVSIKQGDGYKGWPEKAPFDAIILTAAPGYIPKPLKDQLKIGGRLLAPVGKSSQRLILLEKTGEDEFREENLLPVMFVPMKGESEK